MAFDQPRLHRDRITDARARLVYGDVLEGNALGSMIAPSTQSMSIGDQGSEPRRTDAWATGGPSSPSVSVSSVGLVGVVTVGLDFFPTSKVLRDSS